MNFDLRFPSFFHKQRLNAVGIPMLCGVFLFLFLPKFFPILAFLVLAILFLLLWKEKGEARKILLCAVIGISLSMILFGITSLRSAKADSFSGKSISAEGVAVSVSKEYFDLSLSSLDGKKFSGTLRCEGDFEVSMGDRICVNGTLSSALSSSEKQDEIFLKCEVENLKSSGKSLFFGAVGAFRKALSSRFGEGRVGAFLKAILLGDRDCLSSQIKADFQKIASSHLLAISGLHITQIIGFLVIFLRFAGLPKQVSRFVLIPLIFVLFFLAGAGISVFRACVMTLFAVVSALFRRRGDSVTALIFAACLIAIRCPYAVLDPSFLFSFSSTFAILVCVAPVSELFHLRLIGIKTGTKKHFLFTMYSVLSAFLIAGVVFVFNLPIQLFCFGTVSVLSPLYALILIPLFGFCLLLALVFAVMLFLPFSVPLFPSFCRGVFELFLDWVSLFARISPNPIDLGLQAPIFAALILLFLAAIFIFRMRIRRVYELYFLLIALFLPLSVFL